MTEAKIIPAPAGTWYEELGKDPKLVAAWEIMDLGDDGTVAVPIFAQDGPDSTYRSGGTGGWTM